MRAVTSLALLRRLPEGARSVRRLFQRFVRLTFALLALPCVECSRSTSHAAEELPARPNIVFILSADMGFSDLGCYGGQIETPRLDELASGGLRFTQFYNTARCWPTRGAIMTGFYAQQIRRDALPTGTQ